MNINLDYEGFETCMVDRWTEKIILGVHYIFKFENNYGASVVKTDSSYGGDQDLWELAVIRFNSYDNYELDYDTPITNDVLGYLTNDEVKELLRQIKEL